MRAKAAPAIIYLKDESGLYSLPNRDPLRHARLYAGAALSVMATQTLPANRAAAQTAPTQAPAPVAIGDTVVNPDTGQGERVVALVRAFAVLTDGNNIILTATRVGDTFTDATGTRTYTVTAVTTNAGGRVSSVTLRDDQNATLAKPVLEHVAPPGVATNGQGNNVRNVPSGTGDVNVVQVTHYGNPGGDGNAAVEVCVFDACLTIGPSSSDGGKGADADPIALTVAPDLTRVPGPDGEDPNKIRTVSQGLPGIYLVSAGGNGGKGGAKVGNSAGGAGGRAGAGGDITLTASVPIETTGDGSHGIYALSQSGRGGKGGNGYVAAGSGTAGGAGRSGDVKIVNSGMISTFGNDAIGIFAQSLGGAAGDAGGSYGIVGERGDGSVGGNGGVVNVTNDATIITSGARAHGIFAQSVGGSGGNLGTSVGIVTLGGTGGAGGIGGNASVTAKSNSHITTTGEFAYGIFTQSIGGGGGAAGRSVGVVTLGAENDAAGDAGLAAVTMEAGSTVATSGKGAHGVFVQSIGGGGGDAGNSTGVVALGGTGNSGGAGSKATATIAGTISTRGEGARGLFVQSIGGGGGSAGNTSGVVAVGGTSGTGSAGGTAEGIVKSTASIATLRRGADAVFVQSIGGGGGVGAISGGLAALGGSGGDGGNGGQVIVKNDGVLDTQGERARGIFAQSIGGGGGAGGDSLAIISIGGKGAGFSDGGNVAVDNYGTITTAGLRSTGIVAQSVGGGGGDGGRAIGTQFTLGGKGGGGGNAGNVTVNQGGAITTRGEGAAGIFAQAIGGGGGSGGGAISVNGIAGVAIGGSGDKGGRGGDVTVNLKPRTVVTGGQSVQLDSYVSTTGNSARAITAQSVGGGGGDGGYAVQVAPGILAAVSVAVGGKAAAASHGGAVTVDGKATLLTGGDYSEGLFAESIGGGGGSGGFAVSVAVSGGPGAGSVSVGVGGEGGAGGNGGAVKVTSGGAIATKGAFSTGMIAQSVGGGGGNGGFVVSVAAAGGIGAGAVSVGVGGKGGSGGYGEAVDATFDGSISTRGNQSGGALIQSVGGGGGNGGFTVSGSISAAESGSGSISVGVGGSGGDGGEGKKVYGKVGGAISTLGDDATGLLVQSVGGGGGNGGFNVAGAITASGGGSGGASVGFGGTGGIGGKGGAVTGVAGSTITTSGDRSDGLVVQSVGGGGGNGGFNVSGAITLAKYAGAVLVGLGGAGGGGGDGDEVTGSALGYVSTTGDQARGVVIQSNGGGGGNGGFNVSGGVGVSETGGNIVFGMGGAAGTGGSGKAVVADAVSIRTAGYQAGGFLAQSAGGGGGSGGFNVSGAITLASKNGGNIMAGLGGGGGDGGDGDTVTAKVTGTVVTLGDESDAIVAQSLGGGGGSGGFNVSAGLTLSQEAAGNIAFGLGGSGGKGGNAKRVDLDVNTGVTDDGTLFAATTRGRESYGVIAQSLGGGGGAGGFNVDGLLSLSQKATGNLGVGVGGMGGDGGDSGFVVANVNGYVHTDGDQSGGILVQSAGGGGGAGGFNVTGGIALSQENAGNLLVGVGGFGGKGGHSDAATATVTSDIATLGNDSAALTVQSLGGAGGVGAFNVTGDISITAKSDGTAASLGVGVGGFGGDGGWSASSYATYTGNIVTLGDRSLGALVQSVGGGGGAGGFDVDGNIAVSGGTSAALGLGIGGFGGLGGYSGAVRATLTGDVLTEGAESGGAIVQSVGGGGGNGGINVTGSVAFTAEDKSGVAGSVGIGGFGGDGGRANTAYANITGDYQTSGAKSDGIVVQSVGGGGGRGGLDVAGSLAYAQDKSATVALGIGGFGGKASDGDAVTLIRTGDTRTSGADADGIVAQSVGGGGGKGGISIAGGISASAKGDAGSFGLGVGGFGGEGGNAGNVTASVTGSVVATGAGDEANGGSNGVMVQSIGGGGGAGGINVTGDIAITFDTDKATRAASIGIGGFGADGGHAGTASLTVNAPGAERVRLAGAGDYKSAAIVQSVGGGGGVGGIDISGSIALDGQLDIGIGGFGGDGGYAQAARAGVDADLFAYGEYARGLSVQSIGGGGGLGGINISGSLEPLKGTDEPSLVFGLGGFGGKGNISGAASADHNGAVTVSGRDAVGILVQSIAGGGGSGGLNVSANESQSGGKGKTQGLTVAIGVGGKGGTGADAAAASLVSTGDIFINARTVTDPVTGKAVLAATDDTGNSNGIVVQSIGGGGGAGGANITGAIAPYGSPIAVGVGGTGGAGGNAGAVTVDRGIRSDDDSTTVDPHLLRTFGDNGDGLVAQSIGGGGGNAGFNVTVVATFLAEDQVTATLSVGGSGGDAGVGADVTVRQRGDIQTSGADSDGIQAMSISKGGGNGNFNFYPGLARKANSIKIGVGGEGGAGGSAGHVRVDHSGTIITEGDGSYGIRAQSIGGGGGNASTELGPVPFARNQIEVTLGQHGGDGGVGGAVDVIARGAISTSGKEATGILAQSIGGGGGTSGSRGAAASITTGTGKDETTYNGSLNVGLDGGEGATGGIIDVKNYAAITTTGEEARGVVAQSIGGGGGVGGGATTIVVFSNVSGNVAVGGNGGHGAAADLVGVLNAGSIETAGDRSDAVLAQSIGGGGGIGGTALTINVQKGDKQTTNGSLAVGGSGGEGGVGGTVSATNTGYIRTAGITSYGIRAQSIGGGGGVGGAVIDARVEALAKDQRSFDINIGGKGGKGNAAGTVDVTNEGTIYTQGDAASAISANSIGGGGGDAGMILNATVVIGNAESKSTRGVVNIGGTGGAGGVGNAVTVKNHKTGIEGSGLILTEGADAHGIFAQSIGGGGGNSSSIMTFTGGRTDSKESVNAAISIGAKGGDGNVGGTVDVRNDGLIQTNGDRAHGILAQSIGGGGGDAGMVLSGALLIGPAYSSLYNTPTIAIGGVGGTGDDGGKVSVSNSGRILTFGADSYGILAQSIGGGGGNAGFAGALSGNLVTSLAGDAIAALVGMTGGGKGGIGGEVFLDNSGDIAVYGAGSVAMLGQSINGGGGKLNLDFKGTLGQQAQDLHPLLIKILGRTGRPATTDPIAAARLGAIDATNTNAEKVHDRSTGTAAAYGDNGAGLLDQSVGGGGGTATMRMTGASAALAAPGEQQLGAAVALGGSGGSDSDGAAIDATHSGTVLTAGKGTPGILAQSIGGGGGRAVIELESAADMQAGSATVVLGAENVDRAAGGSIQRTQAGAVQTSGDFASGALLQSVGGGGGAATIDLRRAAASATAAIRAMAAAASGAAPVTVVLGAAGGVGLDGGAVNATFSGGMSTNGDYASALVAQSVGGGGGQVNVSGGGATSVALGGSAGASGNGGAVSFTNDGAISTTGARANGLFLQSVGGGGGAVFGDLANAAVTLSSANSGDGGAIRLNQRGDVSVLGSDAVGVVAQSVGGGGGWVDGAFFGSAGGVGRGGGIDLTLDGAVYAPGTNATGILAQSVGTLGGGTIRIVSTGAIRGGTVNGVGVRLVDGTDNLITTTGSISAVSGLAVEGGAGNDRIENGGVIVGNLKLGGGANAVLNRAGATFVTLDTLNLRSGTGSTGTFTNAGDLQLGLSAPRFPIDLAAGETFGTVDRAGPAANNLLYGTRVISTVALNGDFVQTSTGHAAFDVAFGPYASDRLNVTGNATVAGTADVTLTWLENTAPVTLIATAGRASDAGLQVRDTLAVDYSVLANSAGIQLALRTNFGLPFLNRNEQAIGRSIDSALSVAGGSSGLGRVAAYLGNLRAGEEATYRGIVAQLNPEPLLTSSLIQFGAARDFSAKLFGCGRDLDEGESCGWSSAGARFFDRKGDNDNARIHSDLTGQFRVGAEHSFGGGFSAGVAIGYDTLGTVRAGTRFRGKGEAIYGGVGVRYGGVRGLDVSLSASAGRQWFDTVRTQDVFGLAVGTARQHTSYYQGGLNASYTIGDGPFFARPAVHGWVTALRQEGFEERGLGGLGVRGLGHTQVIASVNPELSLGARLFGAGDRGATLSVSGGGIFHDKAGVTAPFRLLGANPLADAAQITSAFDKSAWKAGAALTVAGNDRLSLRLGYDGDFGKRIQDHRGTLALKVRF